MTTETPSSNTTPEILVPPAPLWLLSFAADAHPLSCAFVLISDGFSFDDAFLRARAAATVPPGKWDVTAWEVPEAKRLGLGLVSTLVPGQRLTEAKACELFGPRSLWDWRAAEGPRRRALIAAQARADAVLRESAAQHEPCDHDVENTESCCVDHGGQGACLCCRKCLRWVSAPEIAARQPPPGTQRW